MLRVTERNAAIPAAIFLLAACVAMGPTDGADVQGMSVTSVEASGWFRASGEWALFESKRAAFARRSTLGSPPPCVNVVNGTGSSRGEFERFDGDYVQVIGELVDYQSLDVGTSPQDSLLSRKYWNNQVVHNSCLSSKVFIAASIKSID